MSVLQQVFGGKYNDEKLISTVQQAIAVDPLLQDTTAIIVTSKKGMIELTGKVHNAREKDRTESVIRTTLNTANLKFNQLVEPGQVRRLSRRRNRFSSAKTATRHQHDKKSGVPLPPTVLTRLSTQDTA